MDAFSSIVAVVMAAVATVSVGSFAEGKRQGEQYKFVTRGGTKGVRGVPKRHKADVCGGRRRGLRNGSPTQPPPSTSYERHNHIYSYEHQRGTAESE
ncbi:hypothetical protein F5Y12DRAFT_719920 [Xylaria sp. FL1777]|nr:hypothetical protein F5Y12DRAFT_719920 [Xylaria sp. FL1777]